MIDLHTHTTASDGSFSPEELIRLASEIDLRGIAITDHDTVDGISRGRGEARVQNVPFISGVEISAEYRKDGTMHILGYLIDEENEHLEKGLDFLKDARRKRNPQMIKLLNDAGITIMMDDVVAESGGGEVGRPHIAKAIVKGGFASSITAAFDRYIGKEAPYYVDKARLSISDSISLIRKSGGIPVLAHPKTLNIPSPEEAEAYFSDLKEMGLMGIECYYYSHSKRETKFYLNIANELGLLVTGGSDFHGANKPDAKLGVGKGNLNVPEELMYGLLEAKEKGTAFLDKSVKP